MKKTIPVERVEAMLTAYQSALSNYDAKGSAALWGTPGMMLNDEMAGVLDDRKKMADGLASSYPFYKALGLDRVEHTLNEVEQLSERVVRVFLTWHFFAGDTKLVDGDYHYVMRDDEEGLRMYVAISVDEVPRLRQLADERGVPFPES